MRTLHIYGYHREGRRWIEQTADYQGGRRISDWKYTGRSWTDWRKADAATLAMNKAANA